MSADHKDLLVEARKVISEDFQYNSHIFVAFTETGDNLDVSLSIDATVGPQGVAQIIEHLLESYCQGNSELKKHILTDIVLNTILTETPELNEAFQEIMGQTAAGTC